MQEVEIKYEPNKKKIPSLKDIAQRHHLKDLSIRSVDIKVIYRAKKESEDARLPTRSLGRVREWIQSQVYEAVHQLCLQL